jgi:hypothetical protein
MRLSSPLACPHDGLAAATAHRVALIRAERRAFDRQRAARRSVDRDGLPACFEIVPLPFDDEADRLRDAMLRSAAKETGACVGFLAFLVAVAAAYAFIV